MKNRKFVQEDMTVAAFVGAIVGIFCGLIYQFFHYFDITTSLPPLLCVIDSIIFVLAYNWFIERVRPVLFVGFVANCSLMLNIMAGNIYGKWTILVGIYVIAYFITYLTFKTSTNNVGGANTGGAP